jgi:ABC-type amino acid transport system permease subunit
MTTAQPGMSQEPRQAADSARRKGRMEQGIETVASGAGNTVAWLAESGVLFAIFAVIWVAFGAALIFSQGSVDQAWQSIRELPLIVQLVVWVLFLPVMIGLWVWETTWPLVVRLVLVVGIAGWNLFMFLPKALQAKP